MTLPRDRVYFHYNYFNDATSRIDQDLSFRAGSTSTAGRLPAGRSSAGSWTDHNVHDPASRRVVRIALSHSTTARDPGTRVATSIQQVASSLRQDGLGVGFDGVFVIEDARHRTDTSVPGARVVPSQIRTLMLSPAAPTRLTATASPDARSLQSSLIAAGFTRASFVEAGNTRG